MPLTELPKYEACRIKADETRTRYRYCSFHVDDAHRRFDEVRRACEGEGAKCNFSTMLCCGGLRCEHGVGICRPAPARAAARDASVTRE